MVYENIFSRLSQRAEIPEEAKKAVQHVNRRGDRYFLQQGLTKSGKPSYFFTKKTQGPFCEKLPDGFEIDESPRGQVLCRRIQKKWITDEEVQSVRDVLAKIGKQHFAWVYVKGKDIVIYEDNLACLKFSLCDEEKRLFQVSRWCFRGSVDDWIKLLKQEDTLMQLARTYCPHLAEESFFELI